MADSANCFRQIISQVITSINAGIIVLAPDHSIVIWNEWMEQKSGVAKQQCLGSSIQKTFPGFNNKRFFSAIDQAINRGNSSTMAQSIDKAPLPLYSQKNGDERDLLPQVIDIKPLGDRSNEGYFCLIQINDVTSTVKCEQLLRKQTARLTKAIDDFYDSEMRTQAIMQSSGDGVIITDKDGYIQSFNRRAEQIFGYRAEEVHGHYVDIFFTRSYARRIPAFTRMLLNNRQPTHGSGWLMIEAIRKDGVIFPVNVNYTAINIAGSVQFIGIVRDLTDLEESQRSLQESNDALKMALESGELWMWDWNAAQPGPHDVRTLKILGYDLDTMNSEYDTWESLIHPHDWPRVMALVEAFFKGVIPVFEAEYRLRAAEGDWIWVYGRGKVVARDEQGKVQRAIGINQNITQRKLAEFEAKKATDEAIEAARAKSVFMSNMSHELRTPMNGIMGVLNLLQNVNTDPEQREYIEVAKRSADALLKLIDNVLEFSRLNANSIQLELIEFDPEEILKDVVKLLAELAKKRSNTIDYQIADNGCGTIMTDPHRLRQVLVNLVGNALKFTSRGHIEIRIFHLSKDQLLFEVEDNGIGIPADRHADIFDAFTQADVSITCNYGGTGLGLGISKQLVELLGGTISIVSNPGEGSVFSFTIKNHALQPADTKTKMVQA